MASQLLLCEALSALDEMNPFSSLPLDGWDISDFRGLIRQRSEYVMDLMQCPPLLQSCHKTLGYLIVWGRSATD